ncbi:Beta-secretase 2 [Phytophthora nicotianae]|uniref:Beta-secretase 2 n=1 Tax=Phytophthora nicotianae TaxID=4792 RepID=A0A0W8DIH3_PHYNI|nr:Beta-secretase 2 [Phytophthora nicotianae]
MEFLNTIWRFSFGGNKDVVEGQKALERIQDLLVKAIAKYDGAPHALTAEEITPVKAICDELFPANFIPVQLTVPGTEGSGPDRPKRVHYQHVYEDETFSIGVAETIAAGGSMSRDLADGFSGMFRNGMSTEATLAQFAISGGKTWYAISTVPPGAGSCTSYAECAATSGKTGYNVAMTITPDVGTTAVNAECTAVTCESPDCEGAYLYPSDDTKLHSCPDTLAMKVTFCPGGSSSTTTPTSSTDTVAPDTPIVTSTPSETPLTHHTCGYDGNGCLGRRIIILGFDNQYRYLNNDYGNHARL